MTQLSGDLGGNSGGDDIEFAPHRPLVEPAVRLRALSDVRSRSVRFLVPGLMPLRTLTLVAGVGGLGKSIWLASVAAGVTTGLYGDPGDVVYVSYEDTAQEVWRPRVLAAEGDLTRVHEVVVDANDGGVVVFPEHLLDIEALVQTIDARLVVVDPIVASIDLKLDAHKDQHVRSVLGQLAALAETCNCAVACVAHLNKAPSKEAHMRVANSTAFWNAARSVVLVTPGEDDDHRIISQHKTNWSRRQPAERHVIEQVTLRTELDPDTGEPIDAARMRFVDHVEDFDFGEALAEPKATGKREQAETLLVNVLGDGEWHESSHIKNIAKTAGLSEMTVKRAAEDLEVEIERRGFPSSTWWRLPSQTKGSPSRLVSLGLTRDPAQPSRSLTPAGPVRPNPLGEEALVSAGPTGELDLGTARLDEIRRAHEEGVL